MGKRGNISLLVTRIIIGGIFIMVGWSKVSDMASTVGYFQTMGIPAFLAYVVGYLELIGGVMLVLGLWTCLVAFVLGIIMLFAIWFTRSMGIQGMMVPIVTFAGLTALFGVCGGKYAIKCSCGGTCGSCEVKSSDNAVSSN